MAELVSNETRTLAPLAACPRVGTPPVLCRSPILRIILPEIYLNYTYRHVRAYRVEEVPRLPSELSPNLGDGLRDQAATVWDCEDAGLAATSIPSVNLTA
jgi:hypothetical protein